MTYQFTELQEKWLKALESGEYEQCSDVLHNGAGYCCLGVACIVAGLSPDTNHMFHGKSKSAPPDVVTAFRLRDAEGFIGEPTRIGAVESTEWLSYANDNGATFSQIAAFIRANPEKVFLP